MGKNFEKGLAVSGKKSIKNFSDLGVLTSNASDAESISEIGVVSSTSIAGIHQNGLPSIRLQRSIKIYCWRVIGKIAKAAKRAELMPVLLRVRECGTTHAGDIAEHLFFEARSRRVVAQRLLDLAERYRLLEQRDRGYVLTESGHTALATEQVFVPEQGTWTIWASDDPLLATPILRVEPWVEPTAYEEVLGKERDRVRERPFEKLPRWVRDAVGVVSVPLVGGVQLRIDHLEAEGEAVKVETMLRAAWDVSGARLRVDGKLGDARVNTAINPPEVSAEAVWMQLIQTEGLWSHWDAMEFALRVGFDDATPGERESLIRAVVFRSPNITGVGAFDPTTVDRVSLRARTDLDASRWAEWRLRARVRDYATVDRFNAWTTDAVAPFAEFRTVTPTREVLADAARRQWTNRPTPSAWHLVAAEDWSL